MVLSGGGGGEAVPSEGNMTSVGRRERRYRPGDNRGRSGQGREVCVRQVQSV